MHGPMNVKFIFSSSLCLNVSRWKREIEDKLIVFCLRIIYCKNKICCFVLEIGCLYSGSS
jgi:hypothetical protein